MFEKVININVIYILYKYVNVNPQIAHRWGS